MSAFNKLNATGDLSKVGAKHSAADQALLDSAHDCLAKLGVGCGVGKAGARHSQDTIAKLTTAHANIVAAGGSCTASDVNNEGAVSPPSAFDQPPLTGPGKRAGTLDDFRKLAPEVAGAALAALQKTDPESAALILVAMAHTNPAIGWP